MSSVLFFIAAIGVIAGAIGVVTFSNPFYSVLALVGHLLSLAVLFLLLRAEFVAAAQVVVYAGAVMVLYVFVVAYVGDEEQSLDGVLSRRPRSRGADGRKLTGALFAGRAARRAVDRAARQRAEGRLRRRRALRSRAKDVRHARLHRQPAADTLLARVRGVLAAAPDRGGRRRRAGAPARGLGRRRGRRDRLTPLDILRPRGTGTMVEGVEGLALAHARGAGDLEASIRGAAAPPAATHDGRRLVSIGWYLAVSAIVFCTGAFGVMTRRNPLVVLLCLELMLNGANLSLIAFSRMWGNGDGQILALIVMTVAACEVCIGLGMIVAIHRRRLPIDVDELRELQG